MDYSKVLELVVEIVKYAYPISLIFGVTGKFVNLTLDLILNRKVNL